LLDAGGNVNGVEHSRADDFRNTALDCCSRHPEIADYLRPSDAKSIREIDGRGEL
jgi:hypothetical protein